MLELFFVSLDPFLLQLCEQFSQIVDYSLSCHRGVRSQQVSTHFGLCL